MPRNNYKKQNNDGPTKHRLNILKNLALVALAIIVVRLFFIQIIEHNAWVAKANEQHTLLEAITAKRGEIYMMDHGEPVAIVLNQTAYQIVIDPTVTQKEDIEKVVNTYAKEYQTADIDEIYSQEGLRYAIVAKNIPRAIAEKIAESETPAVWLKKTNQRVYPEGEFASGLLGFVNNDGVGQYGVEGSLNKALAGENGLIKTTSDINNVALSIGKDNVKIPAKDGQNIILSIDRSLEKGTEELASEAINNTAATNASVLILNPNNGKVLTMANLPNYNPNEYSSVTDAAIFNNYVTDVPYEPASICKNFAFSAAINEGKMTPDTTFFNQHYEVVDDWKIWNAEQRSSLYGTLTMRDALYWSLNTGSIHALKLLGDDPTHINQQGREKLFDYYYNKFRLGHTTGVELNEAEGFIPDPNEGWGRDSTYANLTFGQNLSITMLQTATAFSAVVNGGTWRTPSILEDNPSQERVEDKILSDETSAMMREMLIHNRSYKVRQGIDRAGYDIGGKSGTAQVIRNGAYDDSFAELVGSYIGFVGTSGEMPSYVIMVKMWGEGQSIGSGDAMSLFDKISNYMIDYMKIKPGGV